MDKNILRFSREESPEEELANYPKTRVGELDSISPLGGQEFAAVFNLPEHGLEMEKGQCN